jgi:hypothetical protein
MSANDKPYLLNYPVGTLHPFGYLIYYDRKKANHLWRFRIVFSNPEQMLGRKIFGFLERMY